MTWAEFQGVVKELLPVDKDRGNIATFLTRSIKNGVLDIQSYIPFYRTGKPAQSTIAPPAGKLPLTTEGNASAGNLPSKARPVEAWVVQLDDPKVDDSSDKECNRYPLSPYPYRNRHDLVCAMPEIYGGRSHITIGKAGDFLVYPSVDDDAVIELHYDTVDASHADSDNVPYDDEVAQAVSDYCKARISLEVDKDAQMNGIYFNQYLTQRRKLYLGAREKQQVKYYKGVSGHFTKVCTTGTANIISNCGC